MAEGSIIQLHDLDGYLAQAQKPIGAVLLLPMIYGLNQKVRELANRLADWGLTTVVWNPYPGHPVISREEAPQRAGQLRDNVMVAQISAWMTYLQEVQKIRSVATVGFCLGGRVGLLHASHDRRVAAHACFYPTISIPRAANQELDVIALAKEVRCPVLIAQPSNDQRTQQTTYTSLRTSLLGRHAVPTIVGFYPEADHGFMEVEHHPGHANEVAAKLAWMQAIGFIRAAVS